MNTHADLRPLIRECVDGGAEPVSFCEIKARGKAVRRVPARRGPRYAVAITGLAAAGAAGALVASQAGGGGTAAAGTVLTAAMIRHVASASQAAMTSGEVDLDWTGPGQTVIQQITFNGTNWNDVINPGQQGRVTHTANGITRSGESINRVVDGQEYHWPAFVMTAKGPEFTSGWMRFGSAAAQPLSIPDPRTLLAVLSPSAGFAQDGTTTVNGVTLQHLRATTPDAVPVTPLNTIVDSEPDNASVSAIDLWVDPSGVVQKIQVTVTGTNGSGAPQSVTVTATFSHVGQAQPITPPASYTALGGKH